MSSSQGRLQQLDSEQRDGLGKLGVMHQYAHGNVWIPLVLA